MKRPMLVSGITTVVTGALLLNIKSVATVILLVSALVLILYSVKKLNLRKHIILPTIFITSILTCLCFFTYNKSNVTPYLVYDNTINDVCGKIITTPRNVENYLVFNIKADKIGNEKVDTTIMVRLQYTDENAAELYDYVCVNDCYVYTSKNHTLDFDTSDLSDGVFLYASSDSLEKMYNCQKTPYYYCLKFRERISETIFLYTQNDCSGLLNGMIFGDTSSISHEIFKSFRDSGIAHLLAVSGLHTSLWCGLLIALLSAFNIPEKVTNSICLAFLFLFCVIMGFTPSVIRASVMMSVILIAPFFKRMSDGLNSLGLAVTLILLSNPYTISSISFQLSASSTLGVLVACLCYPKIISFTNKIPYHPLRNLVTSTFKSLLISCFAGIFTTPVLSYYFGVLCLSAPITNILCVQLSFYAMITGIIAITFSFINTPIIKSLALLLFDVTEFILNIVIEISHNISLLKYSTVPIHSDFLFLGLGVSIVIFATGFLIFKLKENKTILKVTSLLSALEIVILTFIPLYSPIQKNCVTVVSCGNNIQIIVRSADKYAYIENTTQTITYETTDNLPKATCENLKYYIPTYLSSDSVENIGTISSNYFPENTVIPLSVKKLADISNIECPQNTTISTNGNFTLTDEISFEIVDTTGIKYVIIRGKEKTVYVHLYGDTNFSKYVSDNPCNIAVYNGTLPENIPQNATNIVLSIDAHYNPVEIQTFRTNSNTNLHVTSKDGNAVFYI